MIQEGEGHWPNSSKNLQKARNLWVLRNPQNNEEEGARAKKLVTCGTSVPRSPLPSTEQGAERTEQPNIARCSVQFGNISCAPVRFGCSVRLLSRGCCSALVLDYDFFVSPPEGGLDLVTNRKGAI
jgi:hypothetical protein